MFGPTMAGKQRVRCVNSECPQPADTEVVVYWAAVGVIAKQRLICAGCGSDVREEGQLHA